LTPQQIALLRRVGDGHGLPAYVLRPRNCVQDVELLCGLQLLDAIKGEFSITTAGLDYLKNLELPSRDSEERIARLRAAHGRDRSVHVEHWPQEY
jgi:hypothetical protein